MLKTAVKLIQQGAARVGVSIGSWPPAGTLERHLRNYFARMEINVVLDVGAFTGGYAKELRAIGYKGRIISFEPVQDSYEKLHAAMSGDPNWSGVPHGLSDDNREALINTHSQGTFNSLLTLRDDAEKAYSLDPAYRSQMPIQLARLDSVLQRLIEGIRSPRIFMKIDTQGHDVSVVRGSSGVLGMITGLQSELAAIELYEGMSSMAATLTYYSECGFVPIGFYPVNTLESLQISPEFDVLFNRFEGSLHRP